MGRKKLSKFGTQAFYLSSICGDIYRCTAARTGTTTGACTATARGNYFGRIAARAFVCA